MVDLMLRLLAQFKEKVSLQEEGNTNFYIMKVYYRLLTTSVSFSGKRDSL